MQIPASEAASASTLSNAADAASLVGLLVALVGFGFTIWGVFRARRAAEGAEVAARAARTNLLKLDAIGTISSVITALEDMKRLHRDGQWEVLPEKYGSARRALIEVRSSELALNEDQETNLQGTISQLAKLEQRVEMYLPDEASPLSSPQLNKIVARESDKLARVLTQLKNTGGDNDQ